MTHERKALVEIVYRVVCQSHVTARWLANDLFSVFGPDVAIALTPAANGRLEIYLDREKIFDRKAEGGDYPELTPVWRFEAGDPSTA